MMLMNMKYLENGTLNIYVWNISQSILLVYGVGVDIGSNEFMSLVMVKYDEDVRIDVDVNRIYDYIIIEITKLENIKYFYYYFSLTREKYTS